MSADPYRALYLHVPFCVRRCAYCDFHTRAVFDDGAVLDDYISSLREEIARAGSRGDLATIETVYIGGGTPTFLGAGRLGRLLDSLAGALDMGALAEFTVEANPDSLTPEVLEVLVAHGVNRISIGVQSLDDDVLVTLGRVHDARQALAAVGRARSAVGSVSADVICGVPGQSDGSLRCTVGELVGAGISHISVYPLTVEEGTPLACAIKRGEFRDVDEDAQARHMELVYDLLDASGFARYEVASYTLPGFESRHNKAYWTGVSYLGLGDGAASMRNQPDGSRVRETRIDGNIEREELTACEAACEDAMLAMRLVEGLSLDHLDELAKRAPALLDAVDEVVCLGLAARTDRALVPTRRGWLMGNELYGRLWDAAC